jgi:ABC-type antimicrobial peptide transport system ATPase subunit
VCGLQIHPNIHRDLEHTCFDLSELGQVNNTRVNFITHSSQPWISQWSEALITPINAEKSHQIQLLTFPNTRFLIQITPAFSNCVPRKTPR